MLETPPGHAEPRQGRRCQRRAALRGHTSRRSIRCTVSAPASPKQHGTQGLSGWINPWLSRSPRCSAAHVRITAGLGSSRPHRCCPDPMGNETATVAADDENRGATQGRGAEYEEPLAASPKATAGPPGDRSRLFRPPHPTAKSGRDTGARAFTDTSRAPASVRPERRNSSNSPI